MWTHLKQQQALLYIVHGIYHHLLFGIIVVLELVDIYRVF
jgi:hypothetical protein